MTDMIERVARALAECDGLTICSDASYSMSSYGIRAKAAIAAMREPSHEMLRVGPWAWTELTADCVGDIFPAMIDAALGAEDEK